MFENYPEVISVDTLCEMMNICKTTAYSLVRSNAIKHVRIGKKYIIPKQSVIGFLNANCYNCEKIISGGMTVIEKGAEP